MLWRGAVQIFEGVGHSPHLEAPDAMAAAVEAFVAEVTAEVARGDVSA